jgi:NTP pyrophosphatase (non-canonical NTP hydrolase)
LKDIEEIFKALLKFRDDRDWEQFHNPKDLALAISVEASELLELFLWKNSEDVDIEKAKRELADVFIYAFLLADKFEFNIKQIVLEKLTINSTNYPLEKAKGNAKKYNEL